MALLLLLRALQPEFGYTLSACHVNHGLRGAAADRDEAFVRQACGALGVPLRVFHAAELADTVDAPPPHAGEDWARRLRYACFERLCKEGIDAVATAHTANDQAETLLLRLARGTGLHGAAGIRPRRGCYLRPLLCLNRADTEAVCRAAGQTWVTDETNETDAYARNRLRRAALPALQSTNEAATENLARFCEKAAQADAYFAPKGRALLMDARLSDTDPVCWRLEPLAAADAPILGNGPAPSGGPGAGPGRKIYPAVGAAGAAGQRSRAADREGPLLRGRWGAPAGNTGRIHRLGPRCGGRIYRSPAGRKTGPDASAGGQNPDCTGVPGGF